MSLRSYSSLSRIAKNQIGFVNPLVIWITVLAIAVVGLGAFSAWASMGRQTYKNQSDQKVAAAVAENTEAVRAEEAVKYAEEAKKPLKPFVGPASFGRVTVSYPKTWSAYIEQDEGARDPLSGYFHPDFVSDTNQKGTAYALRVEVVGDAYSDVLDDFSTAAEKGKVSISAYKLPKVSDVVGSRVDGEVATDKQGSMVIFPLRNVTLKVWTESQSFLEDFNNNILPNLTFAP